MKEISIVGLGRFGKTLLRMFKDDFFIRIYDQNFQILDDISTNKNIKKVSKLKDIYKSEVIFFAVPISSFEKVIKLHKKYFNNHLIIDVLSVKIHPKKILSKYLKNTSTKALLSHPLFGPDSSKNGFDNLPLVIDKFKSTDNQYNWWINYFRSKKINVIEMSAEQHDKLAANSQGVTHFFGRILEDFDYKKTLIDTIGAQKLFEVKEQTCNDTWELFMNLQNYNPYTKKMRLRIGKSYQKIYNKLIKEQKEYKFPVFGIQGGKASFNREALENYVFSKNINKYKIKYLYTTERVLKNLENGNIDFGVFAIKNSKAGLVEETLDVIGKYKFDVVDKVEMSVKHCLLKKQDVKIKQIKQIIAHPQALAQCTNNLSKLFPNLKKIAGKGDFIDPTKVAWALSNNKITSDTAVLGSKLLAQEFNLEIFAKDLQDDKENTTTFLIVRRL